MLHITSGVMTMIEKNLINPVFSSSATDNTDQFISHETY